MRGDRDSGAGVGPQFPIPGPRFLLLLLALYVVLSVLLFDPKPGVSGDNAIYLILGKSLAVGSGYRDIYLPDAPVNTQYPPGFPLMLAAVTLASGGERYPIGVAATNVLVAKLFVVLTGLGAMFFIYRLCQLTVREKAWPLMLLLAASPELVENNHWVLTEVPFMLVAYAALYCLVLAELRPKATAARLRIVACGLAVVGCYLRTAGLAVLLGMLLLFLVRRQYRDLMILLLVYAAVTVPWQIHNMRAGHAQPYLEQLLAKHPYFAEAGRAGVADWALRIWQNLQDYSTRGVPRLLCPTHRGTWYEAVCGIVLSLLAAIGFWRGLRRLAVRGPGQPGPLAAYALGAVPVLLGWPNVWASDRFLLPFLPLIAVFLFSGLDWFAEMLRWRRLVPAVAGVLIIANAVHLTALARRAVRDNLGYLQGDRYSGYSIDWRRYFEAIDWIRAQTPPDAVVLARKPEFVYLLSGRRSFCYPFTTDRAKVKAALLGCQYVLVDNFQWTHNTPLQLAPVLQDNPDLWSPLFATPPPEFYVLRVNPVAGTGTQPRSTDP